MSTSDDFWNEFVYLEILELKKKLKTYDIVKGLLVYRLGFAFWVTVLRTGQPLFTHPLVGRVKLSKLMSDHLET